MANVLLGVTGSVAAMHTPLLYTALRVAGHQVKVVATKSATYFFDVNAVDSRGGQRNPDSMILDGDEWPGTRYVRGDPVLHIELRRWADVLLIAPLDANTLGKLALGLADNCLTCTWRAWDRARPVVLAPAMNTLMWEHPATGRHLAQVAADFGLVPPFPLEQAALVNWCNAQPRPFCIVPPIVKKLACDDVGPGALAERDVLLAAVRGVLG